MTARDIAALADAAGNWMRAVSDAAARVESLGPVASAGLPTPGADGWSPVLRSLAFRARFFLSRSGKKVVFVFIRRDAPDRIIVDARLTFNVIAGEGDPDLPHPSEHAIQFERIVPDFIWPEAPLIRDADLASFGWRETDSEKQGLFRFGETILAVRRARGSRVRIWRDGVKLHDLADGLRLDNWPIVPLLPVVTAFSRWCDHSSPSGHDGSHSTSPAGGADEMAGELADARAQPIEPPSADDWSETRRVLHHLVRPYAAAGPALSVSSRGFAPPAPGSRSRAPLPPPPLVLQGYRAEIAMLLDEVGRLADESDGGANTEVPLRVRVVTRPSGPVATVTAPVAPPLQPAAQRAAALAALRTDAALDALHAALRDSREVELDVDIAEPITRAALAAFITSAVPHERGGGGATIAIEIERSVVTGSASALAGGSALRNGAGRPVRHRLILLLHGRFAGEPCFGALEAALLAPGAGSESDAEGSSRGGADLSSLANFAATRSTARPHLESSTATSGTYATRGASGGGNRGSNMGASRGSNIGADASSEPSTGASGNTSANARGNAELEFMLEPNSIRWLQLTTIGPDATLAGPTAKALLDLLLALSAWQRALP